MSPVIRSLAHGIAASLLCAASQALAQVTVTLTTPFSGATYSPGVNITLSATATAPSGYTLSKVEFFQGTTLIGTDTSAPYSVTWNSVPQGNYAVTAKANAIKTNNPNLTATSSPSNVIVTARPTVSLTSPVNGSAFSAPANVTISATASDSDGTITRVYFYETNNSDGRFLIASVKQPPYGTVLTGLQQQSQVESGFLSPYTIEAVAFDDQGSSTSAAVQVYVGPTVTVTSPLNGASFTAPATIALDASVTASAGPSRGPFFYNGSTQIESPLQNVGPGTYLLTAKVFVTAETGEPAFASDPVTVTVTSGEPLLTVTSPASGAVVASESVTVSGTFSGPTNAGIAVNGVVAAIVGNTFTSANVPLQPGNNTLTVTLTASPSNQTTTQTLSITSTGPAPIEVLASPTQGMAPLSVTFTINNRTGNAIQSVQADYSGTGSFAGVDPKTLSNSYTASGIYQAAFVITDSTGASYQQTVPIAVQDTAQIDQMLQTTWWGFTTALAAQDTTQALQYFNAQAQQKFQSVFQTLATDLPQIVGSFSAPQLVSVTDEIGEYAINRTIDGVDRIFFIYFVRDVDGIWRIDEM